MTCETNDRRAFRCCIAAENSAAKLKVGGRLKNVCVLDTSRNGFCVQVPNRLAKRLADGKHSVLHFAGEQWEVEVMSRYCDSEHYTNLGLARIRELTKIEMPSTWTLSFVPTGVAKPDPHFLTFLVLAFMTAAICLPGIGDNLGTAPKVRHLINSMINWSR